MNLIKTQRHPILILVRGIPGSGKTYLTVELDKALTKIAGEGKVVTIDPDTIDYSTKAYKAMTKDLTSQGVDPKFYPYRFLRAQAHSGISAHQIIIWNQPFTHLDGFEKTIVNLEAYARDQGTTLPLLVVEVEIDTELAKKRVDHRKKQGGHGPSEATFARFISDYVSFADKNYYTVTVDGTNEVAESVKAILTALDKLQ